MTSQQKSRSQRQVAASGYAALVKRVHSEFSGLEFFVKRLTWKSYWNVGKLKFRGRVLISLDCDYDCDYSN